MSDFVFCVPKQDGRTLSERPIAGWTDAGPVGPFRTNQPFAIRVGRDFYLCPGAGSDIWMTMLDSDPEPVARQLVAMIDASHRPRPRLQRRRVSVAEFFAPALRGEWKGI